MFRYILNDITDQGNDFISLVKCLQRRKMKHELKIIMTYETEDMEHDQTTPILSSSIRVYVDEQPIGCIQKLKLEADCNEFLPKVEITFPDIEALESEMDLAAYNIVNPGNSPRPNTYFGRDVKKYISLLSQAPNMEIKKKGIDDGDNIVQLQEVGTDGFIDSFPMKRRHK